MNREFLLEMVCTSSRYHFTIDKLSLRDVYRDNRKANGHFSPFHDADSEQNTTSTGSDEGGQPSFLPDLVFIHTRQEFDKYFHEIKNV